MNIEAYITSNLIKIYYNLLFLQIFYELTIKIYYPRLAMLSVLSMSLIRQMLYTSL